MTPIMIGQKYGKLTPIEQLESDAHGNARFRCRCACGKATTVLGLNLKSGNSKSCGCGRRAADRKRSRKVRMDGTTRTLREWSTVLGVPYTTIYDRVLGGRRPDGKPRRRR